MVKFSKLKTDEDTVYSVQLSIDNTVICIVPDKILKTFNTVLVMNIFMFTCSYFL